MSTTRMIGLYCMSGNRHENCTYKTCTCPCHGDGLFEHEHKAFERKPTRRYRVAGCNYCDLLIAQEISFAPPHDPSVGCESGKYEHCTCSGCF